MRRALAVILALSFWEIYIPTFIPLEWTKIEPVEWEPAKWPGLETEFVDHPEVIDARIVSGFQGQRIKNTETKIQARFMTIPAAQSVNSLVFDAVWNAIDRAEKTTEKSYEPQIFPASEGLRERGCIPGSTLAPAQGILLSRDTGLGEVEGQTVVVCDIVSLGNSYAGQRIRTITGSHKKITADVSRVIYQSPSDGASHSAAAIWGTGAQQHIWEFFIANFKLEAHSLGLLWAASTPDDKIMQTVLNSTTVASDSSLLVTFPAGIEAPELAGLGIEKTAEELVLKIPYESASGLLSEFGAKLVADIASGYDFAPENILPVGKTRVDCNLFPCVAITYDDGPSALYTGEILDALLHSQSSATFFVTGANVEKNPEVVARTYSEGHMVQNHSWSHKHLTKMPIEEARSEINRTNTVIYEVTGEVPYLFRPPYGAVNKNVISAVGMSAVLWDVDTKDWDNAAPEKLIDQTVNLPKHKSIVLQHDVQKVTGETVWDVLRGLQNRGFSVVNIEQIFDGRVPVLTEISNAR